LFSQESDIVKTMRLIEGLKADLINNIGALYQAMAQNSEVAIKEALARLIIHSYVLGKRLGIGFADLDETIEHKLNDASKNNDALENRFGDFSKLKRFFEQKR